MSAADLQMAQRIEQASISLADTDDPALRSAADAFLQGFRASPRPYALCLLLLQGSAHVHVQFLALQTIKAAAAKEGRMIGQQMLVQIKEQIIALVAANIRNWNSGVKKQAAHTLAILFKWICLNSDDERLKLQQATKQPDATRPAYIDVAHTVANLLHRGQHNPASPTSPSAPASSSLTPADAYSDESLFSLFALDLATNLIAEFGVATLHTSAGVSASQHVRCHATFELHVLFNLASVVLLQVLPNTVHALLVAHAACDNVRELDIMRVVETLLHFLNELLEWQFIDESRPDSLVMQLQFAMLQCPPKQHDDRKVGLKWQPLFVQSTLLETLRNLHHLLFRWTEQSSRNRDLAHRMTKSRYLICSAINELAMMNGHILEDAPPADSPNPPVPRADGLQHVQLTFVNRILTAVNAMLGECIQPLLAPEARVQTDAAELSLKQQFGPTLTLPAQAAIAIRLTEEHSECMLSLVEILSSLAGPVKMPSLVVQPAEGPNGVGLTVHLLSQALSILLPRVLAPSRVGKVTDTSEQECVDLLLDTWATLVLEGGAMAGVAPVLQASSPQLFVTYVRLQLTAFAAPRARKALDDEDSDEDQFAADEGVGQRITSLAAIGATQIIDSLNAIAEQIVRLTDQWAGIMQAAPKWAAAVWGIHESLCFLLQLLNSLMGDLRSATWHDIDRSMHYANFPPHILNACTMHHDEGVAITNAMDRSFRAVCKLATVTINALTATEKGSPLIDYCSPLTIESLLRLFQQLTATGYIMLDEKLWSGKNEGARLPRTMLMVCARPEDSTSLLANAMGLVTTLMSRYNFEEEVMDLSFELLHLMLKHTPIRLQLRSEVIHAHVKRSLFSMVFVQGLVQFLTQDPFPLLGDKQVLMKFKETFFYYNLSTESMRDVADVVRAALTFHLETDCADAGDVAAVSQQRRVEAFQALHGMLQPIATGFFKLLLDPQYHAAPAAGRSDSAKSAGFVLKTLTNYVTFFSGLSDSLYVDNFEFLWLWITASDSMVQIPAQSNEFAAQFLQVKTSVEAHALQQLKGAEAAGHQNILQAMIDIVKHYNRDELGANLAEAGHLLPLFTAVLQFVVTFTENFLPYMSAGQSYRFMQQVLEFVKAFVATMERRSSQAVVELREIYRSQALAAAGDNEAKIAKCRNRLHLELYRVENGEWDVLTTLLHLLDQVSTKDLDVDPQGVSVNFAADAVLSGLTLITPRLIGNVSKRPEAAGLFFSLLSSLAETDPNKLISVLSESQRNQIFQLLLSIFESDIISSTSKKDDDVRVTSSGARRRLLESACKTAQALAQYHLYFVSGKADAEQKDNDDMAAYAAAHPRLGRVAPNAPKPPSPFAAVCAALLNALLQTLLRSHLTPELLDPFSDALLPTILCQPNEFTAQVRALVAAWRDSRMAVLHTLPPGSDVALAHQAEFESIGKGIEAGFQQLIPSALAQGQLQGRDSNRPSSRTLGVERSQRMAFRAQLRSFVLEVRPLMATTQ